MGCSPVKILKIFFCKVKIFPLLEELSQKSIPSFITDKVFKENWADGDHATERDAELNLKIICSI
jgi:hypothetical protein